MTELMVRLQTAPFRISLNSRSLGLSRTSARLCACYTNSSTGESHPCGMAYTRTVVAQLLKVTRPQDTRFIKWTTNLQNKSLQQSPGPYPISLLLLTTSFMNMRSLCSSSVFLKALFAEEKERTGNLKIVAGNEQRRA